MTYDKETTVNAEYLRRLKVLAAAVKDQRDANRKMIMKKHEAEYAEAEWEEATENVRDAHIAVMDWRQE